MIRPLALALLLALASPLAAVEIFEIQGSGDASPHAGRSVETTGNVVTAAGPAGFFMQTPATRADADETTSNGVYVFTNTRPAVTAGDVVDVRGTVTEYFGLTEITNPTVTKTAVTPLPDAVMLTPGDTAFERFEGMLVRIVNGTVAEGTDSFGAVKAVAGTARPFREPGIAAPGLPGLPVWDGNREIVEIETDAFGTAPAAAVGGARIEVAEGPLAFSFGWYEIWATRFEFANPAFPRAVREPAPNELTIGTQNLERLRANDSRLAAVSNHIRTLLRAPDVLAVQEVDTLATLQSLADRIRNDDASVSYRAFLIEGNDPGGIDVGFLVRERIEVLGVEAWGREDTWTPPGSNATNWLHDRPPLVLRASHQGKPFTVIAVHLRSLIDVESASVQAKRHEQALRLSRHIASLLQADPAARLIVAGDFNAFQFSDGYVDVLGQLTGSRDPAGARIPATDEIERDLTNQVLRIPAAERYSYVQEGSAQVLDHALTSQALTPYVRDAMYARANADAPVSANPISDHDGLVLYISDLPAVRRRSARH